MHSQTVTDMFEIARLIQVWGFSRDLARWDALSDCYTPDATMNVTWFHGPAKDFVAASRKGYRPGLMRTKHIIGMPVAHVQGDRAISETNIQILSRFAHESVLIDSTSYARFHDRLVRTADGWRIQSRTAVYEKDRYDPVEPGPVFDRFMAESDFSAYPEPYRYLGFFLEQKGRRLHENIICDGSDEALALMAAARAWLEGAA